MLPGRPQSAPVGAEPVHSRESVYNLVLTRGRNLEQNSADISITRGGAVQFAIGWVEEKTSLRKVTVFSTMKSM
jgi:hypothetical protein